MKAFIYARFSSENQRDESIDAQLRACRDYCAHNGWEVAGEYIDKAFSARTDDRPDFQRMISDVPRVRPDFVVVHKLDRFARNRLDSLLYKKRLAMSGATLRSVLENIDDSPESIMLESVLSGVAEYHSANLSREVKKGLRENVFQEKTTGGFPPLGYDFDENGRYVINEKEAAAVRLIFAWALDGRSYRQIAAELNRMGMRTKIGRPFVPNSIHDILRNEKYMGLRVFNRFGYNSEGKIQRHIKGPNPNRLSHKIPALVSEADWHAINEAMDRRRRTDRTKVGERYLLAGRLECGVCGAAMAGHMARGTRYYRCTARKAGKPCTLPTISCSKVDPLVLDALRAHVLNPSAISAIIPAIGKKAMQKAFDAGTDHQTLRERLQSLDVEISRVVDAIASVGISDALKAKLRALEDEKKVALLALADAEMSIRKYAIDEAGLREMLERDMATLDTGDANELHRLVMVYVEQVIIHPSRSGKRSGQKVEIKLRIFEPNKKAPGDDSPPETCLMMVPPRVCFQMTCYKVVNSWSTVV